MTKDRNRILAVLQILLVAAYPVLHIFAANIDQLWLKYIYVALLVTLAFGLILLAALGLILRSAAAGAFLASVLLILFFSYGHVFEAVNRASPLAIRHRYIFLVWGMLTLGAIALVWKRPAWVPIINQYVTVVGALLVAVALFRVVTYVTRNRLAASPIRALNRTSASATDQGALPDIYYIILDSYSRDDVLLDYYGYDNSEFIAALTQRGFYVAPDSHTNYPYTYLSLTSSLNMRYLDFLTEDLGEDSVDRTLAYQMIHQSEVWRRLDERGYRFVNISSGWGPTTYVESADINFTYGYHLKIGPDYLPTTHLSDFHLVLAESTALNPVVNAVRDRDSEGTTRNALDKLVEVPTLDGPSFVLAHMVIPHFPYVFGPEDAPAMPGGTPVDGEIVRTDVYAEDADAQAYVQQVMFVNRAITAVIDQILDESDVPPIIIIQADHGNWADDLARYAEVATPEQVPEEVRRLVFPIFDAYYLPEGGDSLLYPSITPVNSFRVVLSYYFDMEYDLLEDRSYFSAENVTPYKFIEVP